MTAAVMGAKAFRERWIMQPMCPRKSVVGWEKNRWWVHMRRKVLMRLAFKYKHMLTDTHFLTDIEQDNEVEK